MALYPFQSKDGHEILIEFPMADAPEIGSTITRRGETYRRVISRTSAPKVAGEIRSRQPPRDDPHVKRRDPKTGEAVWNGKGELREYMASHNDQNNSLDWVLE